MIEMERHFQGEDHRLGRGVEVSADGEGIRVERGVPCYNEFRCALGLNTITSFEDLTDEPSDAAELEDLYGGDVEALDLLIGCLAEPRRPTGFGFGETAFQVFVLNASRRLQADRFYTTHYTEEVYTPEGLEHVENMTMKDLLLKHYPELRNTGFSQAKTAFHPWPELAALL